jgi:DNA polymerase III delta prime subunit
MSKNHLDKVKEWIMDLRENAEDPKPFLVLYGTAGVGKTTLAHLILQKYGYEIIECNASDTRSKKQIRETIGGISGVSVCLDNKNNFKKTAIIMDEIDGLNGVNESSGIQELVDTIITVDKKTKETKWVCPVICTSNSIKDKKMQLLLRHGVLLHIDRPSCNDMMKLISRITKAEGFEIDNESRNNIIKKANGDYRQIILLLYDYFNDLKLNNITRKTKQEKDIHKEMDELRQAQIKSIGLWKKCPATKLLPNVAISTGPVSSNNALSSTNDASACDPNYSGCIPPYPPDLDCSDIKRLGMAPVQVLGKDLHKLDGNGDGVGCE